MTSKSVTKESDNATKNIIQAVFGDGCFLENSFGECNKAEEIYDEVSEQIFG